MEFRQIGTADKKVEGTGPGLALARKFGELHGGLCSPILAAASREEAGRAPPSAAT